MLKRHPKKILTFLSFNNPFFFNRQVFSPPPSFSDRRFRIPETVCCILFPRWCGDPQDTQRRDSLSLPLLPPLSMQLPFSLVDPQDWTQEDVLAETSTATRFNPIHGPPCSSARSKSSGLTKDQK